MNKNWKTKFYTIWVGQAISLITSAVLQMVIIWHLTSTTGSAAILSIASLVGFLPQAILGSMIGVLVDRWDRKVVMISSDLIIATSGLVLVIISLTIELPIWVILVILFIRSVGSAFYSPALDATTPLLVPEDQLAKCAGYTQSIQSVSFILSPVLAAFVYAQWGLNAAVAMDVLGALFSSLMVALVAIPKQKKSGAMQNKFFEEFKQGYYAVKGNKLLFTLLCVGTVYAIVFMPVSALFPLMSLDYFKGTTFHASIVETTFAVGMLIGGLLLGTWGGFKRRILNIIGSIALMGISLLLTGLLPVTGFIPFVILCAFMGISVPFYNGVQVAIFQEKIEPEYLGRVFGLLGSMMSLAMPIGLIFSGLFADRLGIQRWFGLSGIVTLFIALVALFLPAFKNIENNKKIK